MQVCIKEQQFSRSKKSHGKGGERRIPANPNPTSHDRAADRLLFGQTGLSLATTEHRESTADDRRAGVRMDGDRVLLSSGLRQQRQRGAGLRTTVGAAGPQNSFHAVDGAGPSREGWKQPFDPLDDAHQRVGFAGLVPCAPGAAPKCVQPALCRCCHRAWFFCPKRFRSA